jgi:nucleoid DNA-binding protein
MTEGAAPKPAARRTKKASVVTLAPVAKPVAAAPHDSTIDPQGATALLALRHKDFSNAVAARCEGVRKSDLRAVLDATLGELAAALSRGQPINLAGFGKVRVVKKVDRNGAEVLTLKFHPASAKKAAQTPLANDED